MKLLKIIFFLVCTTSQISCVSYIQTTRDTIHIFYLHGRIVEEQGKNAISEAFGAYEFDSIVEALKVEKSIIYAEIRTENVDVTEYANKISKQIDSLLEVGVLPKNITVIGASKGAIIASNISNINESAINYIFLAGNNNFQEENNNWKFHGQVLAIFEKSDSIAGKNYDFWQQNENFTTKFDQLELNTNLGHGFLYKPLSVWVEPAKSWILNQSINLQKN